MDSRTIRRRIVIYVLVVAAIASFAGFWFGRWTAPKTVSAPAKPVVSVESTKSADVLSRVKGALDKKIGQNYSIEIRDIKDFRTAWSCKFYLTVQTTVTYQSKRYDAIFDVYDDGVTITEFSPEGSRR